MEKEDLEAIAEVIIEKDIFVLSDEIYSELSYKGDHVSITTIPGMKERTILINGFSAPHVNGKQSAPDDLTQLLSYPENMHKKYEGILLRSLQKLCPEQLLPFLPQGIL